MIYAHADKVERAAPDQDQGGTQRDQRRAGERRMFHAAALAGTPVRVNGMTVFAD